MQSMKFFTLFSSLSRSSSLRRRLTASRSSLLLASAASISLLPPPCISSCFSYPPSHWPSRSPSPFPPRFHPSSPSLPSAASIRCFSSPPSKERKEGENFVCIHCFLNYLRNSKDRKQTVCDFGDDKPTDGSRPRKQLPSGIGGFCFTSKEQLVAHNAFHHKTLMEKGKDKDGSYKDGCFVCPSCGNYINGDIKCHICVVKDNKGKVINLKKVCHKTENLCCTPNTIVKPLM